MLGLWAGTRAEISTSTCWDKVERFHNAVCVGEVKTKLCLGSSSSSSSGSDTSERRKKRKKKKEKKKQRSKSQSRLVTSNNNTRHAPRGRGGGGWGVIFWLDLSLLIFYIKTLIKKNWRYIRYRYLFILYPLMSYMGLQILKPSI